MKHLQKLGYVAIGSMLTVAIMGTALAASGAMTITVDPVNVQVNGATFAPKDAQGNSVPVFSYNGTTYAPLRALAEAYGLNVGYDSKNNMATVGAAASTETPAPSPSQTPDNTASTDYSDWTAEEEAAYQEFKGMWEVKEYERTTSNEILYNVVYSGNLDKEKFITYWSNRDTKLIEKYAEMMSMEAQENYKEYAVAYYFYFKDVSLGYSFAYPARYALSSFLSNPFNIHN